MIVVKRTKRERRFEIEDGVYLVIKDLTRYEKAEIKDNMVKMNSVGAENHISLRIQTVRHDSIVASVVGWEGFCSDEQGSPLQYDGKVSTILDVLESIPEDKFRELDLMVNGDDTEESTSDA